MHFVIGLAVIAAFGWVSKSDFGAAHVELFVIIGWLTALPPAVLPYYIASSASTWWLSSGLGLLFSTVIGTITSWMTGGFGHTFHAVREALRPSDESFQRAAEAAVSGLGSGYQSVLEAVLSEIERLDRLQARADVVALVSITPFGLTPLEFEILVFLTTWAIVGLWKLITTLKSDLQSESTRPY